MSPRDRLNATIEAIGSGEAGLPYRQRLHPTDITMHHALLRTARSIGPLALTLIVAACSEQALSSRADRRLDSAESRFDALEARVERLERSVRADSARAAGADSGGARSAAP
jgi:hypothetical protein